MPPTMSSFSSTNTCFVNESQPGLIAYEPQSDNAGYWDMYHSPASPSELPSSPSTNKALQNRFFVWVAITRPKLNPIQRYVCPMIGCKHQFGSLEPMLQHLPFCSRLSDGIYYCVESGRNEKIGKCNTPGCQDLRGRFFTAVNSGFKSVKRHFSGRSCKTQHHTESNFEQSSIIPREPLEMNGEWDPTLGISELFHTGDALPEMAGPNLMPSELSAIPFGLDGPVSASSKLDLEVNNENASSYNNYQPSSVETSNDLTRPPAYTSHREDQPSGMDTRDNWMYVGRQPSNAQFGPSELRDGDNESWMHDYASQQPPYFATSPQTCSRGQSYGESNVAATDFRPVQDTIYSPRPDQINQISNMASKDNTLALERSTPSSQLLNESSYATHFQSWTESGTSTGSDTTGSASAFSNASSISTCDSSTSSIDMTNFALGDNQHVPTSFFGNQSSTLFDEPESMYDDLDTVAPLALPARNNYHENVNPRIVRRFDINEVSYDDYIQPGSYLLSSSTEQSEPSSLKQAAGQDVYSPSEATATLSTEESTFFETPPDAPPQTIRSRRTSCQHCKREQRNLTNIPRHERACKMNRSRPKRKLYKCPYPSCTSAFTRSDNLVVHQKKQGHLGNLGLHGQFAPALISSEMRVGMDERETLMMVERAEKLTRI